MKKTLISLYILIIWPLQLQAAEYPISFTDSTGESITLERQPQRVVSIVPSVSEMLIAIGADDVVIGRTHHSLFPVTSTEREVVGGFFRPDVDRIAALQPDIIFYAKLHGDVVARFQGKVPMVCLAASSIGDSFEQIKLLGKLFGKTKRAKTIIDEQKRQLDVIAQKVQGDRP